MEVAPGWWKVETFRKTFSLSLEGELLLLLPEPDSTRPRAVFSKPCSRPAANVRRCQNCVRRCA